MLKISPTRNVGDQITATRLETMNGDLDRLFLEISSEDVTPVYLWDQLQTITDNENGIVITFDRSDYFNPTAPKLYIQRTIPADTNKYTVSYNPFGTMTSIIYWP